MVATAVIIHLAADGTTIFDSVQHQTQCNISVQLVDTKDKIHSLGVYRLKWLTLTGKFLKGTWDILLFTFWTLPKDGILLRPQNQINCWVFLYLFANNGRSKMKYTPLSQSTQVTGAWAAAPTHWWSPWAMTSAWLSTTPRLSSWSSAAHWWPSPVWVCVPSSSSTLSPSAAARAMRSITPWAKGEFKGLLKCP